MYHAFKCYNVNNCWHFNIYEHDNFMLSSVEHEKSFITSGPGMPLININNIRIISSLTPDFYSLSKK